MVIEGLAMDGEHAIAMEGPARGGTANTSTELSPESADVSGSPAAACA